MEIPQNENHEAVSDEELKEQMRELSLLIAEAEALCKLLKQALGGE